MTSIFDVSLLDLLPESLRDETDVVAICLAVDPEMRAVSVATDEANILARIEEQPEAVLDEIAWGMRLNELLVWDTAALAAKRALLKNILAIRQRSGTRYALRRIFDLISVQGEVVEWWEEDGPPHTYRLRLFVSDVGVQLLTLQKIPELVERFARTSQRLRQLAVELDAPGTLPLHPVLCTGTDITIPFGGA